MLPDLLPNPLACAQCPGLPDMDSVRMVTLVFIGSHSIFKWKCMSVRAPYIAM